MAVLLLSMLLVGMGQAWALYITPSSPIAGEPFTVYSDSIIAETIYVYTGSGCSGTLIFAGTVTAGGSLVIPGQPAGQYSTNTNFEAECLNFAVIPATIAGLGS